MPGVLQTGDPQAGKGRRNLKVPDYDPSWDPLTLEYQVKWPLHLILTPQVPPPPPSTPPSPFPTCREM